MTNRIKQALSQAQDDGIITGSRSIEKEDSASVATRPQRRAIGEVVELDRQLLKVNHVFVGDEADSFAMSYKILRTQVYQKLRQNKWKSVGVTSSTHSEGKSLTAVNLAFSLARATSKGVVLLDFDLRRPTLDKKLGLNLEHGVSDYFLKNVPLEDLVVRVSEGLTVVPGVQSTSDASEILSSTKMKTFISELKRKFPESILIFDLPPVLLVDDVLAFSPELDTVMVVAEEGRTKSEELTRTLELLQLTNLLGVVLNKSGEMSKDSYYYY